MWLKCLCFLGNKMKQWKWLEWLSLFDVSYTRGVCFLFHLVHTGNSFSQWNLSRNSSFLHQDIFHIFWLVHHDSGYWMTFSFIVLLAFFFHAYPSLHNSSQTHSPSLNIKLGALFPLSRPIFATQILDLWSQTGVWLAYLNATLLKNTFPFVAGELFVRPSHLAPK